MARHFLASLVQTYIFVARPSSREAAFASFEPNTHVKASDMQARTLGDVLFFDLLGLLGQVWAFLMFHVLISVPFAHGITVCACFRVSSRLQTMRIRCQISLQAGSVLEIGPWKFKKCLIPATQVSDRVDNIALLDAISNLEVRRASSPTLLAHARESTLSWVGWEWWRGRDFSWVGVKISKLPKNNSRVLKSWSF